jgi:hypothetical protein
MWVIEMIEKEMEEFIQFIEARQRLCERMTQLIRIQKLQLELLEETKKSSETLVRLQHLHKDWKVGAEVKQLAKDSGMMKIFSHVEGSWLR